jgi:hypothetical protein
LPFPEGREGAVGEHSEQNNFLFSSFPVLMWMLCLSLQPPCHPFILLSSFLAWKRYLSCRVMRNVSGKFTVAAAI